MYLQQQQTKYSYTGLGFKSENLPSSNSVLLVLLADPSWDTPSLHPEMPENLEGTTSKGLWIVCSHQSEYGMSWRSEEKIKSINRS